MISIIVPIYNAENTLPRCIESMQAQTYGDFELILVNDGSKDDSLAVCRRYEAKDNRIIVIDQPNGGVAAARNVSLDAAKGEYLYCIDPDDHAEPQLLEKMLALQADLVICSYQIDGLNSQGEVISTVEKRVDTRADTVEQLMRGDTKLLFPLWNKLFKRSYIEEHHIRFLPLSFWEDACFIWEYLKYAEKICCIDTPLYHYTVQKDKQSLSRPKYVPDRKRYYLSLFRTQDEMCRYRGITDEALMRGNYVRLCYNITSDLIGNIHRADSGMSAADRVEYIRGVCSEPEVRRLLEQNEWDSGINIREAKICLTALRHFPPNVCEQIFKLIDGIRKILKR